MTNEQPPVQRGGVRDVIVAVSSIETVAVFHVAVVDTEFDSVMFATSDLVAYLTRNSDATDLTVSVAGEGALARTFADFLSIYGITGKLEESRSQAGRMLTFTEPVSAQTLLKALSRITHY